MTVDAWQRLWELYEQAGALPAGEWQGYLERSTNDPGLRARVLGMLRDPHSSMAAESPPAQPEESADRAGSRIGRYRVGDRIGAGGMGEVYAAADVELDRPVALKFVASARAGTHGISLADVLREAKAASALNHPHIVTVHEVIPTEAGLVIVMERIAGRSMRSLCGSLMDAERAAVYVAQAARALAAAHARGIVHRDVKPENLMVRDDDYVKLLDFGLAKRVEAATGTCGPSPAGTLRYMSPEQVRGEMPGSAGDVFSLGIVLYELLTGKHPFTAPSLLQTMQAIATSDPLPPSRLNPRIPARLSALTLQMLNKDPGRRPGAEDVADRLGGLDKPANGFPRRTLFVGAAAAAGASAVGLWYARNRKVPAPFLVNATAMASLPGTESQPSFSPDGWEIAFTFRPDRDWNSHVYRKVLNGGPATRITSETAAETDPVWSPDGKQLAFLRQGAGRRWVMVVPVDGGKAAAVGEIADREHGFSLLCWQMDSQKLVVSDVVAEGTLALALYALPAGGGDRRRLTSPPRGKSDAIPRNSPDGSLLAFVRIGENSKGEAFVMPAGGGPVRQLTSGNHSIIGLAWMPDGRSLVMVSSRSGPYQFWRVPIEGGEPERIEGEEGGVYDVAIAARTGRVAYRDAGYSDVNIWRHPAPPSTAPPSQLIASAGFENDARYSPDGFRLAFGSSRLDGRAQIWTCGSDGSNPVQMTHFGPGQMVTGSPAWSPDGTRIAFDARLAANASSIFVINARGGEPRRLTGPGPTDIIPAWSADGRFVYFGSDRSGRIEIWRVASSGGEPEQVTQQGGFEVFPAPDGQFLYYTKGQETEGIWRRPVAGGEEEFIPGLKPVARHRYWHGTPEGIYFMDLTSGRMIRLFRFSTQRVTDFATAPAPPVPRFRGLTVTPDGLAFLYMQYDVRRGAIKVADTIQY